MRSIFRILCLILLINSFSDQGLTQNFLFVGSASGNNWGNEYPCVFGNYQDGAKHQFLVTQQELYQSGFQIGDLITSIGFKINYNSAQLNPLSNFMIKIYKSGLSNPINYGYYSQNLCSSNYYGQLNLNSETGWIDMTVDPFVWNGSQNLIIETCFQNNTSSSNPQMAWSENMSGGQTYSRYYMSWNAPVCNSSSSYASSTTRPIFRFEVCPPVYTVDNVQSCDTYTWIDGVTYTQNNNSATWLTQNSGACNEIITLNLTINYSSSATDLQSACDSYTWIDGNTYTESNNSATYTLSNASGCDSIVTLNLTINSNATTDEQSACDSYTWIDGMTYTSNNNNATQVLTNTAGCDSVVTLSLTLFNSNQTIDEQVACDVFTWIDGNTYTQSTNIPFVILENQNGCDSTVFLELTMNESSESFDVNQACGSFTWIDGTTYTENNNMASVNLMSSEGCDSTVYLNLTFVDEFNTVDHQLACESYTWIDGVTYTEDNSSASLLLSSQHGCDSLVTLDLSIGFPEDTTLFISSFGDYEINGNTYTESGTYQQTLESEYGCDSLVILNLYIEDIGLEGFSEYGISAYPNPFKSILHLDFEQLMPEQRMVLTDINGKVLLQRNNLQLNNVLQLNDLESGMYYLNVFQNDLSIGQLKVIRI